MAAVKSEVRSVENNGGVLLFDYTIQEKEWTDENEFMRERSAPCIRNESEALPAEAGRFVCD